MPAGEGRRSRRPVHEEPRYGGGGGGHPIGDYYGPGDGQVDASVIACILMLVFLFAVMVYYVAKQHRLQEERRQRERLQRIMEESLPPTVVYHATSRRGRSDRHLGAGRGPRGTVRGERRPLLGDVVSSEAEEDTPRSALSGGVRVPPERTASLPLPKYSAAPSGGELTTAVSESPPPAYEEDAPRSSAQPNLNPNHW